MNKKLFVSITSSITMLLSVSLFAAVANAATPQCPSIQKLSIMLKNNPFQKFEVYASGAKFGWNFWTNDNQGRIFLSNLYGIDQSKSDKQDLAVATNFFNKSIVNNDFQFIKMKKLNGALFCSYNILNTPSGLNQVKCIFPAPVGCSVLLVTQLK